MMANHILGAKVAQCIASWAEIETLLGVLLGVILHTNQAAALDIYSSIENRSPQMRMIEAASRSSLPQLEADIVSALIIAKIRPSMKTRDKFAHWTWGFATEIPNALLIRDPSVSRQSYANILRTGDPTNIPADHSSIYVVNDADLDKYIIDFKKTNEAIRILIASLIEANTREARDRCLHQLSSMPDLWKVMDRLRKDRQKNRATPLQEPLLVDGAGI